MTEPTFRSVHVPRATAVRREKGYLSGGRASAALGRWGATRATVLALAVAASLAAPERATACNLTTIGRTATNANTVFTLRLGATDTGDGLPTSWTINWGDGTIETLAGNPSSATHTYTAPYTSRFTYNILASAVCSGNTYFENPIVVPSAANDKLIFYGHDATGNAGRGAATFSAGSDKATTADYPLDVVVGPDGKVYVSGLNDGVVDRFLADGTYDGTITPPGVRTNASGIAFGPDGNLYVAYNDTDEVLRFSVATGAYIDVFVTSAVYPGVEPEGMIFGPDGQLYVSDYSGDVVYKFDHQTGASLGVFTSGTAPRDPEDIVFGPDGHLYVASDRDHKVLRYNGTTGAYIDDFVTAGSGGMNSAQGVEFGPDGAFYVSSWQNDNVLRYDGATGAFTDVYVAAGLGTLNTAEYFAFLPGHQVRVVPTPKLHKPITIDRTKIPGSCGTTLTDYPMLFSVTDPDLANTVSGGDVTDLQGDDILFLALDDATCGGAGLSPCMLDHEIETYVSTTGELVAWVRIPSVNTAGAGSDTVIDVYYGESTVTSPTENPSGVWDVNFRGVWHLKEGTGVTAVDSTSNGNSAVPNSGNPTSDSGQIGGALRFASTSRLRIAAAASLDLSSAVTPNWTMSAWVKPTSYATLWPTIYAYGSYRASMGLSQVEPGTDGRIENWTNDVTVLHSTSAVTLNEWHYVTITRTAATTSFYFDGSADGSSGPSPTSTLANQVSGIGADGNGAIDSSEQFLGLIDEVRVSGAARSSCWVAAEYNNQAWPDKAVTPSPDPSPNPSDGFYTYGAATAVELESFAASGVDGGVELLWETGSELSNLGFHLYRSSSSSGPWERITGSLIPGLGSSPEGARYRYVDAGLSNGVTYYYELEDVETTGRTKRHGPVWAEPTAGVTPSVDSETGDSVDGASSGNVITYGEPEKNALRVVKQGRSQVVVELTTEGFVAYPEEDGSVRIEIPDWVLDEESGLPVERTWVEALAGRQVELVSTRAQEVEAVGLRPTGASAEVVVASLDGVVRLERRRRRGHDRRARRRGGSWDAARVVEVAFQGEVKKALVEMAPLSWDETRHQLRLAKKLYVTLSFAKREPDEVVSADGRRGRRERVNAKMKEASGGVVARLATVAPGLYAVRYEEVFGAGGRRGVSADSLRLSRQGETVPYHLQPSTSRFAPGSTLYFVSPGAEANPYGEETVFEVGYPVSGGTRMAVVDASPTGGGGATGLYLRRDEHEENHLYQAALLEADEPWSWDSLMAPVTKEYAFEVSALAAVAEPGRLELWLQGGSDFPVSPDHHVWVRINGTVVGERSWDGKLPHKLDVELGAGVLREGANTLEVDNVGDTGAAYSMVYMDRYAVTYPRLSKAEGGELEGTWRRSGTAEVSGVSRGASLVDTTEGRPPRWLIGSAWDGNALRFRAEGEHRYLVVDGERLGHPEVRKASRVRWKSESNRADFVVIGPRAFLDNAGPLVEQRRREGLTPLAVPVEEIYEEFGYGESRPEAIREFLTYAYHHWQSPSLHYVLLVGDATYDFKNDYGTNVVNRVPPLLIETSYLRTVSDPTYAAVNGDDLLPDVAIGRLPAASVDEARAMVEKVLAYESGGGSRSAPIVVVSDNPDEAGDFEAEAKELAETVMAGEAPRRISLEELGTAVTRRAVLDTFDEGAYLVSYIGHGGIHLWASENLLDLSSVGSLSPQPQQPLLLTMNCLNGYFHFPYFNSLSEELVKAEGKGAIAAFSPSGMSLSGPAHRYHVALLNQLLHGTHRRLGDAVLAAQQDYADTGAFPELLSIYHLLGDPTLPLPK